MKDYLEKTLRQKVNINKTEYLNDKLPLAFRGRYFFYKVETNGSPWIAIQPKSEVGLVMLRKDHAIRSQLCYLFRENNFLYKGKVGGRGHSICN